MPVPLLVALAPLLIKAVATCVCVGGTCYCAKKAHDAYKKGQKTKQMSIEQKSEIYKAKIAAATESNKEIDKKETEQRKGLEEINDKENHLENQIEELKQANRGNIPEEDRKTNNQRILALQDELDGVKNDKANILNTINNLTKQRDKNNQIINSTTDLTGDNRHWIWTFLTLENILIMLAIYALWQIIKEDRK